MPSSTMTSKYQATIPKSIRDTLQVGAGDRIDFAIESGRVWLRKAPPVTSSELQALEATLAPEWSSASDDVYNSL